MKRSVLMIALLAAPQLALAQEPAQAEPAQPTEAPAAEAQPAEAQPAEAQPAEAQPAEAQPTQGHAAPAPQPLQLRRAQPQQPLQLRQPLQLQLQRAEPTGADPGVTATADETTADETTAGETAEPTLLQAMEPADEAFPEDPAADDALEQGIADGFGDDDLFAPTAEAQEAPVVNEPVEEPVETTPAAEDEAHGPNYPAMIVNFLIWAGILVLLLRKPLSAFLTSRRRDIVDGLEESQRIKEAAERKHAEYTERLAHLDEELESLRKEMIQAGEAERDRIIAEAETRAARMRRDAQFVIDQQMKQLKADLTREAIEAAVKSAEEVLTGQTSAADQERLAKSYLSDVESSMKNSSPARGAARSNSPARHKGEVQA